MSIINVDFLLLLSGCCCMTLHLITFSLLVIHNTFVPLETFRNSSTWSSFLFVFICMYYLLKHNLLCIGQKSCPEVLFISFFKKLYFIYYAIIAVPVFHPLLPSTQNPHSLRQYPHHCLCPWVMHISSLAAPFPIL